MYHSLRVGEMRWRVCLFLCMTFHNGNFGVSRFIESKCLIIEYEFLLRHKINRQIIYHMAQSFLRKTKFFKNKQLNEHES